MLVTPLIEKSNFGKGYPARFMNIIRNPPKHASTCNGILYFLASFAIFSMSSITPYG